MRKVDCSGMRVLVLMVAVCVLARGRFAKADFIFGEPTMVPNVNSDFSDGSPQISRDGLELYMNSTRDGGIYKLWVSNRATTNDPWSTPTKIDAPVNSAVAQAFPSLSADGLELYFADAMSGALNPGGYGDSDLWVLTRASKDHPWNVPENLGPMVNSESAENTPCISADGLELYFTSNIPDHPRNSEILVTSRLSKDDPWGEPVILNSNVNSDMYESTPFISADGLLLFFSRGYSKSHVHVCRRTSTADPWGPAEFFTIVNSGNKNDVWSNRPGFAEYHACFSNEDSTIYFSRGTTVLATDFNTWQVEVTPIVDFNGDGSVDTSDIYGLVDHWGRTDNSLYDIAPAPFGDGIVDVRDLVVLTEYIEPIDRTLIAHWALDETEGITAHDSASGNDGFALGSPVWQPTGGALGGGVQLDGVDDYIIAGAVLKSADWPFSVFAWVKGGAPNQVVISQTMGANWLMADAEGKLITELKDTGESADSLLSQVVITDGNWHEIGFVWDRLHRTLLVDGVVVAEDTQEGLGVRGNGLHIGTGKDAASGTYWSGLIDDVRIYNRAVKP